MVVWFSWPKELVKSLIGCYCGCALSEYTFIPIDMSSGFGGTSAANSITANRISFVLGIQVARSPQKITSAVLKRQNCFQSLVVLGGAL